jgi:hypothetical protein
VSANQELTRASSIETSLENYSLTAANNKIRKSSVTSVSSELYQDDLPKASVKLTNSRNRNAEMDESKLKIVEVNGNEGGGMNGLKVGRVWNQGYLNLTVHYLSSNGGDQLSDLTRQKFYCVLRLDEQAAARTCSSKRNSETRSGLDRVDFNEQFIMGLSGKTCFDIILCRLIEK